MGGNRINWYFVPDDTPVYEEFTVFTPQVHYKQNYIDGPYERRGPGHIVRKFNDGWDVWGFEKDHVHGDEVFFGGQAHVGESFPPGENLKPGPTCPTSARAAWLTAIDIQDNVTVDRWWRFELVEASSITLGIAGFFVNLNFEVFAGDDCLSLVLLPGEYSEVGGPHWTYFTPAKRVYVRQIANVPPFGDLNWVMFASSGGLMIQPGVGRCISVPNLRDPLRLGVQLAYVRGPAPVLDSGVHLGGIIDERLYAGIRFGSTLSFVGGGPAPLSSGVRLAADFSEWPPPPLLRSGLRLGTSPVNTFPPSPYPTCAEAEEVVADVEIDWVVSEGEQYWRWFTVPPGGNMQIVFAPNVQGVAGVAIYEGETCEDLLLPTWFWDQSVDEEERNAPEGTYFMAITHSPVEGVPAVGSVEFVLT